MITLAQAQRLFSFNPMTGVLTWNIHVANICAGSVARSLKRSGYVMVGFNGARYPVHTIGWLITYGEWTNLLDHKDAIRHHNWIDNLRKATQSQNRMNSCMSGANTTGYRGVNYHKASKRFRAYITIHKRQISLGYYDTVEEASAVYEATATKLFGEFKFGG